MQSKTAAKHLSEAPKKRAYPDKLFYKIGEVSKIADVEPYVLRYWETEFPFLRPRKSKSGQRIYVKKDLELILEIRTLLYSERFTIEGVRKKLSEGGSKESAMAAVAAPQPQAQPMKKSAPQASQQHVVEHVKARLRDILARLEE